MMEHVVEHTFHKECGAEDHDGIVSDDDCLMVSNGECDRYSGVHRDINNNDSMPVLLLLLKSTSLHHSNIEYKDIMSKSTPSSSPFMKQESSFASTIIESDEDDQEGKREPLKRLVRYDAGSSFGYSASWKSNDNNDDDDLDIQHGAGLSFAPIEDFMKLLRKQ